MSAEYQFEATAELVPAEVDAPDDDNEEEGFKSEYGSADVHDEQHVRGFETEYEGDHVDVDTGLSAAHTPPDLPPLGDSHATAAAAAASAVEGLPGPPSLPNNAELVIPAKWLSMYEELKRFHATHGHCNVPKNYEENKQLGAWVQVQRKQYKLLTEDKPSYMSQSRMDLLKDLDFEWSVPRRRNFWTERYAELVEYQQKHNSTRVSDKYSEAPQLYAWVCLQRRQLKLYKEGKPNKLTEERARMLEAIGLEWKIRNSCTWLEYFLELKDYKDQHGNCNVPQKYKANPSLGRWVDTQKTQHKKLYDGKPTHLTIERIQLLVSVGFQFR